MSNHEETHGLAAPAAEPMVVGSAAGTEPPERAGWRSSRSFAVSVAACSQGWVVVVGYRMSAAAGTAAEAVALRPRRRRGVVDTPVPGIGHDRERLSSLVLARIGILEAAARTINNNGAEYGFEACRLHFLECNIASHRSKLPQDTTKP